MPLRAWFKWLARNNHILYNPASDMELPKLGHRLPKHVLTVSEAEQIIALADVTTNGGLRDRAILETLYSTGIRRMEVCNLRLYDVDYDRGTIMVRQGKGQKDRMVPIGERALAWIERYVAEVRPLLEAGDTEGNTLFLTDLGQPFTPDQMTAQVRHYVQASNVGKPGACHLWRHTAATLLHDAGADIRFIQVVPGSCPAANDRDLHAGEHPPAQGDSFGVSSVVEAEATRKSRQKPWPGACRWGRIGVSSWATRTRPESRASVFKATTNAQERTKGLGTSTSERM